MKPPVSTRLVVHEGQPVYIETIIHPTIIIVTLAPCPGRSPNDAWEGVVHADRNGRLRISAPGAKDILHSLGLPIVSSSVTGTIRNGVLDLIVLRRHS